MIAPEHLPCIGLVIYPDREYNTTSPVCLLPLFNVVSIWLYLYASLRGTQDSLSSFISQLNWCGTTHCAELSGLLPLGETGRRSDTNLFDPRMFQFSTPYPLENVRILTTKICQSRWGRIDHCGGFHETRCLTRIVSFDSHSVWGLVWSTRFTTSLFTHVSIYSRLLGSDYYLLIDSF